MTPRSCIVEWGYDTQEIRTPGVGGQSCTIGGIPAHLYLAKHVSLLYVIYFAEVSMNLENCYS